MKEHNNLFDDFNLHARIIPALIVTVPIYVYLVAKNIISISFIEDVIINSCIGLLLVSVFYRVVRNLGKKYEEKMYEELGGKPSTILLRYSNSLIDDITKTRYHKKLNKKVSGIKLPTKKEEEKKDDDIQYESAINWLRKYANSNRDKEKRVYQELKDYNFWRNLYGSKKIIIWSCLITIIIEIISLGPENLIGLMINPYPKCVTIFTMIVILIFFCIIIKKKNVKNKAFDYAKALLEVCDNI